MRTKGKSDTHWSHHSGYTAWPLAHFIVGLSFSLAASLSLAVTPLSEGGGVYQPPSEFKCREMKGSDLTFRDWKDNWLKSLDAKRAAKPSVKQIAVFFGGVEDKYLSPLMDDLQQVGKSQTTRRVAEATQHSAGAKRRLEAIQAQVNTIAPLVMTEVTDPVLSTCFISLKNYVETLKKEVLLAGNAAQEMREYASRPGERLLQMAQNYFGTPYTEMDCSTFVRVVARDAGMPVKRVDPKKPYVHTTDYWFNEGLGDHFKAMKFGASEEISIKQVIEAASANPRKIPPGSVLISQKQRLGDGAERSGHAAFFVGVTKYDKDQNSQIMIYDSNAVESNMGRVADPQAKILLGNPQGVGPHVSTLHWNPEAMVKVFLPLPPPKTPPKSSPRAAEASSGGRLLASPA